MSEPAVDPAALQVVQQVDLFEHFRLQTLADVLCGCKIVDLKDGEVLFEYGDTGSSMYVVLEGEVRIYRKQLVIDHMHRGDYVGEMALVEARPRSASACAVGPVKLLEIPGATFDRYLRTDPEAMAVMMRTICRKLRKAIDEALAAYEEVSHLVDDVASLTPSIKRTL